MYLYAEAYLHGFVHLLSQKFPIATAMKACCRADVAWRLRPKMCSVVQRASALGFSCVREGSCLLWLLVEQKVWRGSWRWFYLNPRGRGYFVHRKISFILSLSFQASKEAKRSRRWICWCCLLTYPFGKQGELLHWITLGAKPNLMVQPFKYLNSSLRLSKHANCTSWMGRPLTCLCNCMPGGWWRFHSL